MYKGGMRFFAGGAMAGALMVRLGRRSGATAEEGRLPLPGDEIVPRPLWQSTRAITVAAPPEEVWPWVVQMGFPPHRAGWYTPHRLDRLMWGDRPPSADTIVCELQDLAPGDKVPDSADWSVYYDVVEVERPRHLLLHSVRHVFGPLTSSDFSWVFVLQPHGESATRLLVRARVAYRPVWALPMIETLLDVGDFVNVSVMLRGIRERAERAVARSSGEPTGEERAAGVDDLIGLGG
jgi:hypothetical protein